MKYFLIFLLICFSSLSYSANIQYAFNNSSQQYAIERAVYDEVMQQSLNSKCLISVDTTIPQSFIANFNRYVDVRITIYKDKRYITSLEQRIEYETFNRFKHKLFNIIMTECR